MPLKNCLVETSQSSGVFVYVSIFICGQIMTSGLFKRGR